MNRLRHPVPFRSSHVGGRGPDAEPLQHGLELVGRLLRAPVVPEPTAQGEPRCIGRHVGSHPLPNGLQGHPAISLLLLVPPDHLRDTVI